MRWTDLLRMSAGSLRRRKLRTFLTVLGVVIGTASIVVMISLGLGLQQSMYEEVERNGGTRSLTVTGQNGYGGSAYIGYGPGEEETSEKYITDDVIDQLKSLKYVQRADPVINIQGIGLKGNYEGYLDIYGMTQEALAERIGKSVNFVGQVEGTGTIRGVSLETLFKIAQVLKIPPSKLLEDD